MVAPLAVAGIAAAAAIGGQMLANASNQNIASETNAQSLASTREQMAFQKEMSNTAYQRQMNDMRAAGLNPMLAMNAGGASSPAGSSFQAVSPHFEDALGKGVSSALETRRLKKELDATDSQVDLNNAIKATQNAQTQLNTNNAKVAQKNAEVIDAQMPAIKQRAILDKKRDAIDSKMAVPDAILRRTQTATGIINDAASVIKPKINIGGGGGLRSNEGIIDLNTGEILQQGTRKR